MEKRVQQARLQTLKSDFEMLHMKEDETIDTFTAKLTTLVNKAASLGHTMEDETLVRKLLNAVPDRYLQIVASIEQYSDLSEMTLEEAIGRLKTYEERIKYKEGEIQWTIKRKLMFTDKRIKNNFKKSSYDTSKLLCFKCKEYGHFANKCPSKKEEQSNLIEEDLEPTLLMTTIEKAPGSFINQEESEARMEGNSIQLQIDGFMIDHNNEGGSNQKNKINLDLRKITTMKVEVTKEKYDQPGCKDDHKHYKKSKQ
ncbi:zinc finger, CCHC-type containing protein [Tanacetum coccineum]